MRKVLSFSGFLMLGLVVSQFLPMMAGVTELIARVLVCVAFVPDFGYTAACMASPVAWIFADTLLVTVYFVKMKSLKVQLAQPAPAAC